MYTVLIVDYTHLHVLYFHLESSTLHDFVACQQNVSRMVRAECLEYESSVSTIKIFTISSSAIAMFLYVLVSSYRYSVYFPFAFHSDGWSDEYVDPGL